MMNKYKTSLCFCLCGNYFQPIAAASVIAESTTPLTEAVKEVFGMYSGNNGLMSPDHLLSFLVEVQGEVDALRETALHIIECFHRDSRDGLVLNLDAFFCYLASEDNSPLNPSLGVHQDMKAPLSHYFIYSGHNSYLKGNQLSSESSDLPIIKALNRGVRVIELDLWPNSTRDHVEVRHGRTLTPPVELSKCLKSIKEHAFVASPYPVIITFEDHLTSDFQAKVAEMLKEIFGDLLFYPTSDYLGEFPSPEDLKFRILISTKQPKEFLESKSVKYKDTESQKETDQVSEHKVENDEKEDDPDSSDQQANEPDYGGLIAITAKKGNGKLSKSLKVDPERVTRLSLNELLFEKAVISRGPELIRFTQKNILRIYPKGIRVTSSNYNPLLGWMYGAQMVALNMQGYGRSLWLMHGFYRANGGCGYIKKPDFMLNTGAQGEVFDPMATLPVKKTLKVKVYMGYGWHGDSRKTYFGTNSVPIFCARVGVAGVPRDTIVKKTKKIEDWTPVWNEEFSFPLTIPELSLLGIKVCKYNISEKDGFAGQNCLPISELRTGIRAVPLFDRKGNKLNSVKLLMHFEFV